VQYNLKAVSILISKTILILTLLLSGITKIIDPVNTIEVLGKLNFFNERINVLIVSFLPVIEILLVVLLTFNIKIKTAKFIILIMFAGFLVFSVLGYVLGLNKDCGCFGSLISSSFEPGMIIRNLIFLLMAIILYKNNPPVG